MSQFNLDSISLVKTKSVSSRDARRMVDLIVMGISQYISTPLLRHAKTKSVLSKSNNFVLLRDKNSIVGFGMYRIEKSICIVYEIHVDADYRSMGCGTALMEHVLEDQKGKKVVLFVHKKNHRAQMFYKKFGFEFEDSYEDRSYFKMSRDTSGASLQPFVMIESNIIKRFIVKTFMHSSDPDISKVAEKVMSMLLTRFMLNEHVLVPSRNLDGKICERSGSIYKIATPDAVVEVPFEEIVRKFRVDFCDVCYFLECITMATPLGRIVIENVFDRITQPEFGRRTSLDHPSVSSRGSINCSQIPVRRAIQDTEIGSSGAQDLEPSSLPEKPQLDLATLRPYSLPGVDEKDCASIIRIYMFFSTFGANLKVEKFAIGEMVYALRSPEYSSTIVFGIHASLIEMIEKDIKAQGPKFLGELAVLVEDLPDFQLSASPTHQSRKQEPLDAENWKTQAKIFIQNLAKDLDTDRVLRFMDFAKKDCLALRIELICFLLDVVSFTESMRDLVSSSQSQIKAEKLKADQLQLLKRRTDSEAKAELQKQTAELESISFKNLSNPLRAHIGRYKDHVLLLIDGLIVLKSNLSFYLIGSAEARVILKNLDTSNRTERITSANLGGVVDVLFKS